MLNKSSSEAHKQTNKQTNFPSVSVAAAGDEGPDPELCSGAHLAYPTTTSSGALESLPFKKLTHSCFSLDKVEGKGEISWLRESG
jgi:hypothetical protein